jgi:hypothetical protein
MRDGMNKYENVSGETLIEFGSVNDSDILKYAPML